MIFAAPSGTGLNHYAGHTDPNISPFVNYPLSHAQHDYPDGSGLSDGQYTKYPYTEENAYAKYPAEPYPFQQEELAHYEGSSQKGHGHSKSSNASRKGKSRRAYQVSHPDAPIDPVIQNYAGLYTPIAAGGEVYHDPPPSFGGNPAPFVPDPEEEMTVEDEMVDAIFTPISSKTVHGIEGGIGAAVLGGAGYGARKLYKNRKQAQEERKSAAKEYELVSQQESQNEGAHLVKRSGLQPTNPNMARVYSTRWYLSAYI